MSDDAQTPAEEPVEDLLNFLADLMGTSKVHVDVLPALLREAADKIERLQEEINDLRLQVVTLSIPKETRHG